jgi:CRP/FNR family cyclic AMP-dependent transcriptional regulator
VAAPVRSGSVRPSPAPRPVQDGTAERLRRVAEGQIVYDAGQPAAALYILAAGRVHLRQRAANGAALVTEVLKPGALFGLDSLSGGRHAESAIAARGCLVRELPLPLLDRLLLRQPGFAAGVMEALLRRRCACERLAARVVVAGVPGRLAGALLDAAEDGTVSGLTRQQLAEATWTTRETATRVLYHFADAGIVRIEGRHVVLLDAERLHELTAGARYTLPAGADTRSVPTWTRRRRRASSGAARARGGT